MTPAEVLDYMPARTGKNLLYREIQAGKLRAVRLGQHKLVVTKASLLDWLGGGLDAADDANDDRPEPLPLARRRAGVVK